MEEGRRPLLHHGGAQGVELVIKVYQVVRVFCESKHVRSRNVSRRRLLCRDFLYTAPLLSVTSGNNLKAFSTCNYASGDFLYSAS